MVVYSELRSVRWQSWITCKVAVFRLGVNVLAYLFGTGFDGLLDEMN